MSHNLRARLDRLERAAPAPEPRSILDTGVFWAMVCGDPGPYTPAEVAEWKVIWGGAQESLAAAGMGDGQAL